MLHAFNANDGTELFAYVPNAVFKSLNQLTHPAYLCQPYVDGQIAVAEATVRGKRKTVLAAGMGGGAQGIFVLDVSDPEDFGGGDGAIWEFTDADDSDMGNVFGLPQIAQFMTKAANGASESKYFVVVPSGLNNYENDGAGKFNHDGAGALFLLSLDKNPSTKWQLGINYFKYKTPSLDRTLPNGLGSPGLVIGAKDVVRYAYAGDLQGNLWRFDFSGTAPWPNALSRKTPLFTATDDNGMRQPITMQPKVVFAPGPGYIVLFGTGKMMEEADLLPVNFRQQSFYGIYDSANMQYAVQGRHQLLERTLEKVEGNSFKITGANVVYGTTEHQKRGWYIDFSESRTLGERSITPLLLSEGKLYFNSLLINNSMCAAGGGRSYLLDSLTGLSPAGKPTGYLSRTGLISPPVKLDTITEISARNATGGRKAKRKHIIINPGAGDIQDKGGTVRYINGESVLPAGRLSWREIPNWQEPHNANKK